MLRDFTKLLVILHTSKITVQIVVIHDLTATMRKHKRIDDDALSVVRCQLLVVGVFRFEERKRQQVDGWATGTTATTYYLCNNRTQRDHQIRGDKLLPVVIWRESIMVVLGDL